MDICYVQQRTEILTSLDGELKQKKQIKLYSACNHHNMTLYSLRFERRFRKTFLKDASERRFWKMLSAKKQKWLTQWATISGTKHLRRIQKTITNDVGVSKDK